MSNDSAVTTLAAFRETLAKRKADDAKSGASSLVVLYFWAAWHPPCTQMNAVVAEVAKQHGGVQFLRIDVDNSADVAELYDAFVDSVPTFLLYKGDKQVAALKGASAPELVALVNAHAKPTAVAHVPPQPAAGAAAGAGAGAVALGAAGAAESKGDYEKRVLALTAASPVVAFLNGSPTAPRDDASRELVQILNECRVNFGYFDVASDAKAAAALKAVGKHADWPQLYAAGKHVGGLEEVKDLKHGAELLSVFPREALGAGASGAELTKRLLALVSQRRVMLFMKGTPEQPQCGFSRKAVALLQSLGGTTAAQVPSGSFGFGTFDIFTDESVRMGLKEHFNWPTYPQLYVDGKLVGGLDVMNEMNDESELKPLLHGNGAVAPAPAAAAAPAAGGAAAAAAKK